MDECAAKLPKYTHLAALLTGALLVPGVLAFADAGVDEKLLEEIRGERISKVFMKTNPGYVEEASKSDSGTVYKLAKDDRVVVLEYDLENKMVKKTYTCTDENGDAASYEKRLVKRIRAGCPAELTSEQVRDVAGDTREAKIFAKVYPKYEEDVSEADGRYLYTMTYKNRHLEIWHDGAAVTHKRFVCFELGTPVVFEKNISKKTMKNCLLDPTYIEYSPKTGIPEGHPASAMLEIDAVKAFVAAHPLRNDVFTDRIGSYDLYMVAKGASFSVTYRDGAVVGSMYYTCLALDRPWVNGKPGDQSFVDTIMNGCMKESSSPPQLSRSPLPYYPFTPHSDVPQDHPAYWLAELKSVKAFVKKYPDHVTWFGEAPSSKDVPYYSYALRSASAYMWVNNQVSINSDGSGLVAEITYHCIDPDDAYFAFKGYDSEIKKIVKSAC